MNGPEHYHEAERLIGRAEESWEKSEPEHNALLLNAQVHATLALAAATAESIVAAPAAFGDRVIQRAWSVAIS